MAARVPIGRDRGQRALRRAGLAVSLRRAVTASETDAGRGLRLSPRGRGRGFYVWAARIGADDQPPAHDGVRTSWSAQGYTFWVQAGPGIGEDKPTVDELAPVVAASRRIRPPPADG